MTTIAYKDGVMASDSQFTTGHTIWQGKSPKIYYTGGGIIGFSGDAHNSWITFDFLDSVVDGRSLEKAMKKHSKGQKNNNSNSAMAVFVDDPREIWMYNDIGDENEYYEIFTIAVNEGAGMAIGSGAKFAEAAMLAGSSAPRAVEIACMMDAYSGGDVVSHVLE